MVQDRDLADDDQPGRLTHVIFNVALGHVRLRGEDTLTTTVEVPPGEVRFRRVMGASEPEIALWLDSAERDYLGRMLEHTLTTIRITPEAREALQAVRQKLQQLGPPPIVAHTPEAMPTPAPPLLEEPGPLATQLAAAPEPTNASPAAESTLVSAQAPAGESRGPMARPVAQVPADPFAPPPGTPPAPTAADRAPATRPPAPDGTGAPEALPTPAPSRPPAIVNFEGVWRDLEGLQTQGPTLHSLAGQASSEIREVTSDGVWLYSHGMGRQYLIGRDALQMAWATLAETGQLQPRELRGGLGYGAATLLAHLPYVEYSADPITLYFPASALHPLGTVSRRELVP